MDCGILTGWGGTDCAALHCIAHCMYPAQQRETIVSLPDAGETTCSKLSRELELSFESVGGMLLESSHIIQRRRRASSRTVATVPHSTAPGTFQNDTDTRFEASSEEAKRRINQKQNAHRGLAAVVLRILNDRRAACGAAKGTVSVRCCRSGPGAVFGGVFSGDAPSTSSPRNVHRAKLAANLAGLVAPGSGL